MKFILESVGSQSKALIAFSRGAGFLCALLVLVLCPSLLAQTPIPAAKNPAGKDAGGFSPGWTLGARFEGDYSSNAGVYDVGTALGYNFSRHFGMDAGVPFYFISTPTSIKQSNPGAASGVGIGNTFLDLLLTYPNPSLNYSSAVHLTAPIADTKKGFSTGHATWNYTNHIDRAFGDWSPFLDAGVGNTILDTKYFTRPFMSFGYNAAFTGGLEYDKGPFSLQAGAYDVAPWGNQTEVSRVFRCGAAAKCSSTGTSTNRKGFTSSNVTTGGSSLTRDNGYEAGFDFKPVYYLDFEFDYSRSVPLHLNNYSFGIGVNLSSLVRPRAH
ncbi:MAG TPA: hypothetical protein VGR55_17475 [Candidatus Acidoferrum sp.]|nr:hypothetical protein [Candidatus Acidoferrum sp.]